MSWAMNGFGANSLFLISSISPDEPEKGFMRQDEFLAHTQP